MPSQDLPPPSHVAGVDQSNVVSQLVSPYDRIGLSWPIAPMIVWASVSQDL